MKSHPYAEIFPLLEGERLNELIADIKTFGLREPIWLYEAMILDGRNRFVACEKLGVEPEFRTYKGTAQGALALVVSANIHRRQLTDSQRAMAAARIATLRLGSNQHADAPLGAPSQTQVAEQMDISRRSVQRARQVIDRGSHALRSAVESGQVPLARAAAVVDRPKPQQLAAAKAPPLKQRATSPKPPAALDGGQSDPGEEAYARQFEKELAESTDKVMAADDKLAAVYAEMKRQAAEIATLKVSRDGYLNGKTEITRMLEREQRKTTRLEKRIAELESENEALRERIAIMEGNAS